MTRKIYTDTLGTIEFPPMIAQHAIDHGEYFHNLHNVVGHMFCIHLFTVPSDNPDMGEIQWNLLKYEGDEWSDSLEHGSIGFFRYADIPNIPA